MNASPFSARLNQTFLSPSLAAFSPALNRVVPSFFCACCGGISAANLFFFLYVFQEFYTLAAVAAETEAVGHPEGARLRLRSRRAPAQLGARK